MNGDQRLESDDAPESSEAPDIPDDTDARWAAIEVPEKQPWSKAARTLLVVLLVVLAVDAFFLWRNWDAWTGCFDADDRIIDEASGLCYTVPPGWSATSAAELEAEYNGPGTPLYTSGLELVGEDSTIFHASSDGEIYTKDGATLEEVSEALALGNSLMQSEGDEPEVETESITVDGCEAVTTTASREVPPTESGEDDDMLMWTRVTVVDVGDGISFLYSSTLTETSRSDDEDGPIAGMETVHDSIAVS
jgi:hypothetical protein